jgi:hypothetical protein
VRRQPLIKPGAQKAWRQDEFTCRVQRIGIYPVPFGLHCLREIRELGYSGGYGVVTDNLRAIRPPASEALERRFETPAGIQAHIGFAVFAILGFVLCYLEKLIHFM